MKKMFGNRRGFTLIEVMIATLVFAVGMMAVISMEFSAIRAYTSGRDLTIATDMGSRTIAMMRAEGSVWSQRSKDSVITGAQDGGGADISIGTLYGTGSPIDPGAGQSILGLMTGDPWGWKVLTINPVDAQFKTGIAGRYCVYVRGGASAQAIAGAVADVGGTDVDVTPLIQSQIAVVYPGGQQGFGNQTSALATCDTLPGCAGNAVDLLQPEGLDILQGGVDALPEVEQCGWRAVYMGALISRSNG